MSLTSLTFLGIYFPIILIAYYNLVFRGNTVRKAILIYAKILYGNPPYISITNYNNADGPKVLMIRDSYASVVAPYFAESCSQLVMLDTRIENGNFTGSIINCINQFQPDIVITCECTPQGIVLNK